MTTAATSLLGLALPVTGELSGTWGDTVNTSITALLDSAVAGTTTLSADADVTLTTTTLAANQAREAIILWTAGGTATRYITAPAQSKTYVVLNKTSSTQSIVLRGVGPTTGVTVLAGKQAMVAWDGADFVEVSSGYVDGPASSTDNAIARFDGTDGKLIQNSVVTIADTTGNMAGVGTLGVGAITTTGALVGAVSQDAFNTVSTTLNIGGAATTIGIGAATGTLTVSNTTLAAKAITASTTLGVTGVSTLTGGAVVQGLTVGKGGGAVATNTAVGISALAANTTGVTNTAMGDNALAANIVGGSNAAFGYHSLINTTGGSNSGFGSDALALNNSGALNTGMGKSVLFSNTTGSNNTALGANALYSNTTASNNTAQGYQALYSNTTGNNQSAFGYQALYTSNRTADNNAGNSAFGYQSAYATTTGQYNSAFGWASLTGNTTGDNNVAVGMWSLKSNTTGSTNTAIGRESLQANTTASNNTAVGYQAGYSGTTGAGNQLFGYQAGYSITTGSKNVIIGGYTGSAAPISATGSNYIVLSDGDGNVRGTFDSSGNLGIGTTSPSSKLHVATAGTSNYITNSSDTADGSIQGIVFVGGSLNRAIIRAVNESTNGGSLQFFTYTALGTGTQNMTLTSGGNLGIGVTSPAGRLDVGATTDGQLMTQIRNLSAGTSAYSALFLGNDTNATAAYIGLNSSGNTARGGGASSMNIINGLNSPMAFGISGTEKMRLESAGNLQMQAGAVMPYAPAPAAISAAATLSNANIQGQIISATGTTYTITMPLGTTLETLATWAAVNVAYDFFVINTATGIITMAVNTGVTSLGLLTIAAATSAHFRIRRTAANTFVLYRLS